MKIGIDIRLIGKKRTGDEVVFLNLVRNLAQIDSENEYLLFTDTTDVAIFQHIETELKIAGKKNFKIIPLPCKNRFQWNFWTLPMYLRKNPVDIYHTQYITPWFVPKNVKIITTIHDISWNFFPQFIKFSDLFFLKTLIPISLRRANKIIAVSEFTRNEIIKYYKIKPEKVEKVYNSIAEKFHDDVQAEKILYVKDKYGLPDKFILYVGTLQPRKNIPALIEAFASVKNKLGGMKLVIVGNKKAHNFDKRIDEVVEKFGLGNEIVFPGFVDEEDKVAVFRSSHAFVLPSFYEGFGVPILEAMSQNIPVLAADIPSLKEIGQNSALYFDISSLADFSNKLYDICTNGDLRRELTITGETRVSFFSWENSARKTLEIYEALSN